MSFPVKTGNDSLKGGTRGLTNKIWRESASKIRDVGQLIYSTSPRCQALDLSPVAAVSDVGDDEVGVDPVVGLRRVEGGMQRGDGERRECGSFLLCSEPLQLL